MRCREERMVAERLAPPEYLEELRALRETITAATSRAQALEEEKPAELADGLELETDLGALVSLIERVEERAEQAVKAAEILAATRGITLED
jgi:hypothetical protein